MLAHLFHHLLSALPVPLLPMIRSEFSLDYTRAGFVSSAFVLPHGISQLPAGWLADRMGARTLIVLGLCGVAVAGLLVGLSQTFIMLIVFLALMGILGGGYHPASPPLISASVEPQKRGQALGLHLIGGAASFFLAPLIAAAIATQWGWRGSFIGLAIPTLIFGAFFYVLMRRVSSSTTATSPTTGITTTKATPAPGHLRRLTAFLILTSGIGAGILSIMSFIPLLLVDQFGVSMETAAASIAFFYSSGLWASLLGGYFSDRWGRIPVMLIASFLSGPFIFLFNLAPSVLFISLLLVSLGILQYVRMAVSEAYIVDQTSERNRSTILGIYYFGGIEGFGVLSPVIGYLIDQYGFYSSFNMAATTLFTLTVVCSLFLWQRHRD